MQIFKWMLAVNRSSSTAEPIGDTQICQVLRKDLKVRAFVRIGSSSENSPSDSSKRLEPPSD